jgi:hypothetical protein
MDEPIPERYEDIDRLMEREDVSVCWGCGRVEHLTPATVMICGECGHVYDYEPEYGSCDICIHDF